MARKWFITHKNYMLIISSMLFILLSTNLTAIHHHHDITPETFYATINWHIPPHDGIIQNSLQFTVTDENIAIIDWYASIPTSAWFDPRAMQVKQQYTGSFTTTIIFKGTITNNDSPFKLYITYYQISKKKFIQKPVTIQYTQENSLPPTTSSSIIPTHKRPHHHPPYIPHHHISNYEKHITIITQLQLTHWICIILAIILGILWQIACWHLGIGNMPHTPNSAYVLYRIKYILCCNTIWLIIYLITYYTQTTLSSLPHWILTILCLYTTFNCLYKNKLVTQHYDTSHNPIISQTLHIFCMLVPLYILIQPYGRWYITSYISTWCIINTKKWSINKSIHHLYTLISYTIIMSYSIIAIYYAKTIVPEPYIIWPLPYLFSKTGITWINSTTISPYTLIRKTIYCIGVILLTSSSVSMVYIMRIWLEYYIPF